MAALKPTSTDNLELFVTGLKGFETALLHEIRELLHGLDLRIEKVYGGLRLRAGLDAVYLICLHSRLANRVFCELARARIESEQQLYDAVYAIEWERHLGVGNSLAVAATVSRSRLDHGHYVALKTKDAIVDRFRTRENKRPTVAKNQPDVQVHVHLHRNRASISLDLSGESLHRRGYRSRHGGAPLKENLAAALLHRAGWNAARQHDLRLVDPMCGSGTFVIEAAQLAAGIAPGLQREYFGFCGWRMHDPARWRDCLAQARAAVAAQPQRLIYASDYDQEVVEIARVNARRAGVEDWIEFSHQQLAELTLPAAPGETLVICNPPYGHRMQGATDLAVLYDDLGALVRRLAPARLAIISANPDLLHRLQLARLSRKPVRNGPLECLFAVMQTPRQQVAPSPPEAVSHDDEGAAALRNRLRKNARHLERWARRNDISCYRLYDADLPEFAFALDRYRSEVDPQQEWFHLQEYQAPASIDPHKASERIRLAVDVVARQFDLEQQQLYCKLRSRQRGKAQYGKLDQRNEFFQVREGSASLLINLSDYLDSGLFLDHRPLRLMVNRIAAGKSVLNLFCYTGSVGVQAALGGAASVLNVDLSARYLDWARENFHLNRLDDESRYQFMRADIVEMLQNPARCGLNPAYDLIFFDPPSFSNSKKMRQSLDIQRDHPQMIRQAMSLLAGDGLMLFSSNRRGFRLDAALADEYRCRDISAATLDEDFKRNPKIHRCWEIRHVTGGSEHA